MYMLIFSLYQLHYFVCVCVPAVKAQSRLALYRLSIRLLTIGDVLAQIRTFELNDLKALQKDKSHYEERKQF